jgi:uncharacterized membrane protein YqaE (UPF0057 family)
MARRTGASEILVIILAILLPPVAVVIQRGCGGHLVLNIILCLFGHIPGAIHALYLVLHDKGERVRRPRAPYAQQTNEQAMYGASGDNKIRQQPHGEMTQEPYYDQPRTMASEPVPPTYADPNYMRGEKQEYAPVASGGLPPKEI